MEYLIPTLIFIMAVFVLVRQIRKSFKGEGACHGDCMECQKKPLFSDKEVVGKQIQELHLLDDSVSQKSSEIMKQEEHNV